MPDSSPLLIAGVIAALTSGAAAALGWGATRRGEVASSIGVALGFAVGTAALEFPAHGWDGAWRALLHPREAHEWTPWIGGIAATLSIAEAYCIQRRPWSWMVTAVLGAAATLWLLWGGRYLPTLEVRATGFARDAWSPGTAALIVGGCVVAMCSAWALWKRNEAAGVQSLEASLVVTVLVGAAAAAGLTGSFVYAQWTGALAAAAAGCAVASVICRIPGGLVASARVTLLLAYCLALLSACYSNLGPWRAAGLWIALILAAGWLAGLERLGRLSAAAVRTAACLAPLAAVIAHAAHAFLQTQATQ
jgi:hypothetical protein